MSAARPNDRTSRAGSVARAISVSEKQFQAAVIELARRLGWLVAHVHDSRRQVRPGVFVGDKDSAGLPDLILVKGSRLIFAELKAAGGRVSEKQHEWLSALSEVAEIAPGVVQATVWEPADWRIIERTLAAREPAGRMAA